MGSTYAQPDDRKILFCVFVSFFFPPGSIWHNVACFMIFILLKSKALQTERLCLCLCVLVCVCERDIYMPAPAIFVCFLTISSHLHLVENWPPISFPSKISNIFQRKITFTIVNPQRQGQGLIGEREPLILMGDKSDFEEPCSALAS